MTLSMPSQTPSQATAPPRSAGRQSSSGLTREQQLAEWKRQREAQRKQEKTTPSTRAVSNTTPRSNDRPHNAEQRRASMTAPAKKRSAQRAHQRQKNQQATAAERTKIPEPHQQLQQHEEDRDERSCQQEQEAQQRDSFDRLSVSTDSSLQERYAQSPLSNASTASRKSSSPACSSLSSSGSSSPRSHNDHRLQMHSEHRGRQEVGLEEAGDEGAAQTEATGSGRGSCSGDEELVLLDERVPAMDSETQVREVSYPEEEETMSRSDEISELNTHGESGDLLTFSFTDEAVFLAESDDSEALATLEVTLPVGEEKEQSEDDLGDAEFSTKETWEIEPTTTKTSTAVVASVEAPGKQELVESSHTCREDSQHLVFSAQSIEARTDLSGPSEVCGDQPLRHRDSIERPVKSTTPMRRWSRLILTFLAVCVPALGALGAGICWQYPSSSVASTVRWSAQRSYEQVAWLLLNIRSWALTLVSAIGIHRLNADGRVWPALFRCDVSQKLTKAFQSLVESWKSVTWSNLIKDTWERCQSGLAELASASQSKFQAFVSDPRGCLSQHSSALWNGIRSFGSTSLDGLKSVWLRVLPAGAATHSKLIESAREQHLNPLEAEQLQMNGKLKALLMNQEAWALGELKKMKDRRAAFATVTESILSETRAMVLESLQEAKLDAAHHIESYANRISEELIHSIQHELDEYERTLREEEQAESQVQLEKEKHELEVKSMQELEELEQLKDQVAQDIEHQLELDEQRVLATKEKEVNDLAEKSMLEKEKIEAEHDKLVDTVSKLAEAGSERLEAERELSLKEVAEIARNEEELLHEEDIKLLEELEMLAELEKTRIAAEREIALVEVAKAALLEEEKLREEREQAEALAQALEAEEKRLLVEREKVEAEIAETARVNQIRVEEARERAEEEIAEARKLEGERVLLEIQKAADELAQAKKHEEERVQLERANAEAAIAEVARIEEERIRAEHEVLQTKLSLEAKALQESVHEKRDLAESVLEQVLEEEEHQIEAELRKGEEKLYQAVKTEKTADGAVGTYIVQDESVQMLLPEAASAGDDTLGSALFARMPRIELYKAGFLSAGFLLLGLAAAYFLSARYRRLVSRRKRRNSFGVRRKRWQRPVESSDSDFAEEVVLLPSPEYGNEPEPEVLEYLPSSRLARDVSGAEESEDSSFLTGSPSVRFSDGVETISTAYEETTVRFESELQPAVIERHLETTTIERHLDFTTPETQMGTPTSVRRSRRISSVVVSP